MNFSIYTLGDVTLFENALKGVAMMFTVVSGGGTSLWASNTSLGVGMGAVFGGLIAMIVMIYNGALKRQLDWRNLLLPTLLYVALTGPKTTVTIFDAYSNEAPRAVSGVPIGLAFPLGMISQLAFSSTKKLETVYAVPYAGYTTLTQEGYVAPLKILNSLRFSGVTFGGSSPDFQKILTEIHNICLVNNEAFDYNTYNSSKDPFGHLKEALSSPTVSQRSVRISVTGNNIVTKVLSCEESAKFLERSMDAYITGSNSSDAFSLLTNDELKINNLSRDLDRVLADTNSGSKQGVSEMSEGRILDTLAKFTTPNNDQIMQFMRGSLINPSLSGVTQCSFDQSKTGLAKCQSYLTAIEQWKDKSAADATGFVTIMRDGQNLLIVLSIILFPIMVLILVIQGAGSLKIMGSFILYTVSAFMWLPVASIINFYIHLQLHEEFLKWNPTNDPTMFLTIKNASGFYDAISQKLALANQALASVPMICMGLFSGMLMTMNRLTDKWNHASSTFDATVNMPNAVARAPIVDVSSSVNYANANAVGTINGLSKSFNATTSKEVASALSDVKSAEDRSSLAYSRLFSHEATKSLSKDKLMEVSREAVETFANGTKSKNEITQLTSDIYQKNFGKNKQIGDSNGSEGGTNNRDAGYAKRSADYTANANLSLSVGTERKSTDPDIALNRKEIVGASGGFALSATANQEIMGTNSWTPDVNKTSEKDSRGHAITDATRGSYKEANGNAVSSGAFSSHAFQSVLASKLEQAVSEKYANNMSDARNTSFQQAFSETKDASSAVSEKYSTAFQHNRGTNELLEAMAYEGNLVPKMQEAVETGRNLYPQTFAQAEERNYRNLKYSANSANSEEDLRLLAQFQALKELGFEGRKIALQAEYGEYHLGELSTPIGSIRGAVAQGLGNAEQQAMLAANENYDLTSKTNALRTEYTSVAESTREKASQTTTPYGTFGDIYRNEKLPVNNNAYDSIISRASAKYGVPEGLIKAVIHTESGFNPNATSPVGAQGLMQLMPKYHADRGVSNGYNPEQNIMGGTKFLKSLLKEFDGDLDKSIAAYNAGAGNVRKHGGIPPFKETQDYVERVQSRYANLYSHGVGNGGPIRRASTLKDN